MMFSIIVPCYRQLEWLPEALDSIRDQVYTDYEVIVVSDGDEAPTADLARRYGFKAIQQVNKGLASARNTGIMNAVGEYCLFLDADDQLMPNCLEKMAAAIEQTHADIVAPSFKHFGVFNEPLILQGVPTLEDFKTANRLPYFCAIKRDVLLECGGYSPRMALGFEDYHLWFDLFSREKTLCMMQDVLVLYRTKENSMLTEANKHRGELMAQIAKDFPKIFV